MPRDHKDWPSNVSYDLLGKLTGKERNALEQDYSRGYFNAYKIEEMAVYLAKHATLGIRMRIALAVLQPDILKHDKLVGLPRTPSRAGKNGSSRHSKVSDKTGKRTPSRKV